MRVNGRWAALAATLLAACGLAGAAGRDTMLVYIGTYTRGESKGIYVARFDPASGALELTGQTAELRNPSFLARHPNHRFLYACSEIGGFEGTRGGAVAAFAIGADGGLTLLGQQPTHGAAPCHLVADATGQVVLAANYSAGNVAVLPIQADGSLAPASQVIQHEGKGPNAQRQEGPHAHSVTLSADNRFAFVCDLGLDKVLGYRLDPAAATLTPNDPPFAATHPGAGPRHFAFHPSGRFAWAINELDSTITGFAYDAERGALTELEHLSTLPEGWTGTTHCADVHVHPNGKFVYGSNRGHDSLVIFAVDEATGKLSLVGHESTRGKIPRNFALDPSGRWLIAANQDSDNLVVFAVDPATGRLTATGGEVSVPAPVCVLFAP